jgi:drug/metabolite transporter (DMT)-like permease
MSKNLATSVGLIAIVMWASMVGLIKHISAILGPELGITLIYSFSAIIVVLIFRFPDLKKISKTYLVLATLLFIAYELCFSFAIAYSKSSQQAIEVSIVNYLWPSFTILAFVIFKELKFNFLIVIGLIISIAGIIYIQAGNDSFSINSILSNLQNNPLSYLLALTGAIIWALYCVITRKMSKGHNPISIFFIGVTVILWFKLYIMNQLTLPSFDLSLLVYLLLAAAAVGLGYAAWNIGIIHGNITILVVASYFTPIISSILAMLLLQTKLSVTFWQGTAMVTAGSLMCWISTNWILIQPRLKNFLRKSKYFLK